MFINTDTDNVASTSKYYFKILSSIMKPSSVDGPWCDRVGCTVWLAITVSLIYWQP